MSKYDDFLAHLRSTYPEVWAPQDRQDYWYWAYMLAAEQGWWPLIEETISKLQKFIVGHQLQGKVAVVQIKEKFGGLRIYVRDITKARVPEEFMVAIGDIRGDAEDRSYQICELCGEPGILRQDLSWIATLCDKHHQERREARENNGQ